ncbi:MAG: hypothetical protein A2Z99_19530 [Treponema sp. GWB1_62_6]|nr:MAG: hypothetical protein A2001_11990 [Treponema sp. GWC1_61_84]OHE72239.1 MAG: hypothetical protein A2Z99_19530 [Treponema sp. GWB1_62_6]HCM28588.1 hypothetical protein [Treponema sp.]
MKSAKFAAALAATLALLSCSAGIAERFEAGTSRIRLQVAPIGSAYLSILSSRADAASAAESSASSSPRSLSGERALMAATAARARLMREGVLIDEWTTTLAEYMSPKKTSSRSLSSAEHVVPVGTGYVLELEIYNAANGEDPVVEGNSDPFDVASDSVVQVTIVCRPSAPIALSYGTARDIELLPARYFEGADGRGAMTAGSEAWFSFVGNGQLVRVVATTEAVGDAPGAVCALAAFDADGVQVENDTGGYAVWAGQGCSLYFQTDSGATYYVAAVDTGDVEDDYRIYQSGSPLPPLGTSNHVSIRVEEPVPDAADPADDSAAGATSLTPGTPITASLYPFGDEDWYSFEAIAGVRYDIETSAADGTVTQASLSIYAAKNPDSPLVNYYDGSSNEVDGFFGQIKAWSCTASDTYLVKVQPENRYYLGQSDQGPYRLVVKENAAPATIEVTAGDPPTTSALISWSVVPDASAYRLYRTPNGVYQTATLIYEGPGLTFVDTELEADTSYYFSASAFIGGSWTLTSAREPYRTAPNTSIDVDIN